MAYNVRKNCLFWPPRAVYLENEYFSGRTVYVEFAVGRIVGVDSLSGEEIDDVLRAVLIAVGSRYLIGDKNKSQQQINKSFWRVCKRERETHLSKKHEQPRYPGNVWGMGDKSLTVITKARNRMHQYNIFFSFCNDKVEF